MTDVNLTINGSVESLHLEPGDRIIVTLDDTYSVSASVLARITDRLEAAFPSHQVIILSNGLRLTKQTEAGIADIADAVRRELIKRGQRNGGIA